MEIKLYEIAYKIKKLNDAMEESEGELTSEIEALQAEVSTELEMKTDNCISYLEDMQDWVKIAKERRDKLSKDIKAKENQIASYQGYILQCLKGSEKKEFRGTLYSLKAKKPLKTVEIFDESKIPLEFISTEEVTKISKADIKKALKDGEVEGARLVDGKQSLTIKRL